MREHQGLAGGEVGFDVGVVDLGCGLIRGEVHDDVSPLGGFGNARDLEAGELCLGGGG